MQLNGVASTVLVIWLVISSLVLLCLLAAVAATLLKLQTKLEEIADKVDPLLTKTDALLSVADEKLRTMGDRAETLLATGEEIVVTVQDRVEKTTGTVQRTVNAPIIQANAVVTGLSQAWATFGTLSRKQKQTIAPAETSRGTDRKNEVKIYGG